MKQAPIKKETPMERLNEQQKIIFNKMDKQLSDTTVFLQNTFDPEIYIDQILNDECDYSIQKGIETFQIDEFLDILDCVKYKLDSKFVTYNQSVDQLQQQCLEDEEKHIKTMGTVRQKFNKSIEEFKEIENDISELSTDVMQAGERLQDLRDETKRGKQAKKILKMFREFNEDKVFNPKDYDKKYVKKNFAIIIKKLKTISKELENPNTSNGRFNVDKFYEYIQQTYLLKFVDAMKEKDVQSMKSVSEFLYYLDGGEKCIEEYLDGNQFLMDENDIRGDEQRVEKDPKVERDKEKVENGCMQGFLKKLMDQITKEKREIEKIFICKDLVLTKYLERIFEIRLAGFLTIHLYKGYEDEDPDFEWQYLFKYYDSYTQISDLFYKNLVSMKINGTFIMEMIEKIFEEDKVSNYCPTEIDYIASVIKESKDKYIAKKKEIRIDSTSKVQMDRIDQVLELDNVKYVTDQVSYALTRSQVLTINENIDDVVEKILKMYLQWIEDIAIDLSDKMRVLSEKMSYSDKTKTLQFLTNFFKILKILIDSVYYIQESYEKNMNKCFKYSLTKLNFYTKLFETKIKTIEMKISESISNVNRTMILTLDKMLAYKNEFKFKDEHDMTWVNSPNCTQICRNVCSYLKETVVIINENLTGINKRNFLIKFGQCFHDLFLSIIKKLKITPIAGGFIFMYDINQIYDTILLLDFPSQIKPIFEGFHSLFKIFCVGKDQLIDLTYALYEDGVFKDIDPNEMLKCRTDFSKDMKINIENHDE